MADLSKILGVLQVGKSYDLKLDSSKLSLSRKLLLKFIKTDSVAAVTEVRNSADSISYVALTLTIPTKLAALIAKLTGGSEKKAKDSYQVQIESTRKYTVDLQIDDDRYHLNVDADLDAGRFRVSTDDGYEVFIAHTASPWQTTMEGPPGEQVRVLMTPT